MGDKVTLIWFFTFLAALGIVSLIIAIVLWVTGKKPR